VTDINLQLFTLIEFLIYFNALLRCRITNTVFCRF